MKLEEFYAVFDELKQLTKDMESECFICYSIIMAVGFVWLFRTVYGWQRTLLWYITKSRGVHSYQRYGKNTRNQQEKSWALVTGASDGIGLAYC